MSDPEYDIVIVGAGPSGAIATLYAKRAGLSVCLTDKETFPRDKICGDALSGKALTILRELDLFDAIGDLPGAGIHTVTFGSPDNTLVDIDLTRSSRQDFMTGFVIRRVTLGGRKRQVPQPHTVAVPDTCIDSQLPCVRGFGRGEAEIHMTVEPVAPQLGTH